MPSFRSDIINSDLISKASNDQDFLSFEAENATKKGENFMGDLASVKITYPNGQNRHWIIKMLKEDSTPGGFNLGRLLGLFQNEVNMYEILIPALNNLSNEIKLGTNVPKVFAQTKQGQEALVLEHMAQFGWSPIRNAKQGLDFKHVAQVLEWLATFHGLSCALLEIDPNFLENNPTFLPLSQRLPPPMKAMMKKSAKHMDRDTFVASAELLDEDDSKKFSTWMKSLFDEKQIDIVDLRGTMQKAEKGRLNAINHLDPWFNNVLCKYSDDHLEEVLLLDFQNCGYCNVGNDLAHFLLCSTTKQFRAENLDSVLKIYHDKLLFVIEKVLGKKLR